MGQLSEHESRYSQEIHTRPDATDASSFDGLAKGLASGNLSRRKALRMLGAAMLGGMLASVPGVALAAPCRSPRIRCGGPCCAEGVTTCVGKGRDKTCGPAVQDRGCCVCTGGTSLNICLSYEGNPGTEEECCAECIDQGGTCTWMPGTYTCNGYCTESECFGVCEPR